MPSVAVTVTSSDPTSPFSGVPLNVCVLASNVTQDGNALPLDNVAVYVKLSVVSTSLNASDGTVKLNELSSVAS